MKTIKLVYKPLNECPLCGAPSTVHSKLLRTKYYFGGFSILLPSEGVLLRKCTHCTLLFKSAIPSQKDLKAIMSGAAVNVWKPKTGVHPSLDWIRPYLEVNLQSVLDIGASNGDLLEQLKPFSSSVSALDVVEYPQCRFIVNKEYIIGEIEGQLNWSREQYDVVTAFDIFEHFLDTKAALSNISAIVKNEGKLIIETGDWTCVSGSLGDWYYANLFEHQIFWNRKSFEFFCREYGFSIVEFRHCEHKGRRNLSWFKQLALGLVVKFAGISFFQQLMLKAGKGDPLRFARPSLIDHAFVVLVKKHE